MRGPSTDLKRQILDRIDGQTAAVWTPVDFLDLGARAAVDKALQRLAADGDIRRLDRGLYDRPKLNSLTKKPSDPHTRAIIDAVVRRDQARVVVALKQHSDEVFAAQFVVISHFFPQQRRTAPALELL